MKRWPSQTYAVALILTLGCVYGAAPNVLDADQSGSQFEYFEQYVRPLLTARCQECHSVNSDDVGGNLQLDSRAGWQQGGELGSPIVPGNPEKSLLIQAVRRTHHELHMPPDEPLSDREVQVLVKWIASGAPDPRDGEPKKVLAGIDIEKGREHWAFQSPHGVAIAVPAVRNAWWPQNEVDHFVLHLQEQQGLHPVGQADQRTLIRRATFDLTGLPPTPSEVEAFVHDTAPDAYERLIDRLLASPNYGQRWGRFWLDIARYADSNGLDENIAHGNAWRYRDFVIAAMNGDKPYDEFVVEQLAGDLLPPPASDGVRRERIVATGFLSLGPKVLAEVDEAKMEMDIIDEQVETVGRAFMGLTLGCARCHDHKFDPITTEDYYKIAGIFKSTKTMEHFTKIARWNEVSLATPTQQREYEAHAARIEDLKKRIEELGDASTDSDTAADQAADQDAKRPDNLAQLKQALAQLEAAKPEIPTAMAVVDYQQPMDLRVHVRGSPLTQGNLVRRGFPEVLQSTTSQVPLFESTESGRLALARWLVSGGHPLTARVMVNRIWRWHFGSGLVPSTDNFGNLGGKPINLALLDWLAQQFVADGWSIKQMHRRLMLSATYQLSSDHNPDNAKIDESNRFLWRANARRLEAEAIRDAILAVSGRMDTSVGGSMLHVKNREFLFDHTSKDQTKYDSTRRSIYLPVIRNHLYDGFQLFDYTDASVMNSNRTTTTVAPQALFLMNGNLVARSSAGFAQRIAQAAQEPSQKIRLAYELAFGRHPTDEEMVRVLNYLAAFSQATRGDNANLAPSQQAWTVFCQTLLMSNEFIHLR